jgi:hypothetical protein
MTMQDAIERRHIERPSRRLGVRAAVVAVIVVAGAVAVLMYNDGGPVPADEARIELTYGDDGTSFVGDHEIIEGTLTVTFVNETTTTPLLAVFGYETGSDALAQELAFLGEGERGVPGGGLPAGGFFDIEFEPGDLGPGSHTWTMDLIPGTYLFDIGPEDFLTAGLWRMAVIEVVHS